MTFMRSRSVQYAHIVKPYMTACSIGLRTNGPGCAQLMPESRPGPAICSCPIRQPAALQPMTPLHLLAAAIRACASAPGGLVPTAAIPRTRHPLRTRYFVRMTFMRSRSVQCAHIVKPYMTACSIGLRTNGPGCAQLMPESRPGPAICSCPIRQPAALQPMTPLHLLAAAIRACASAPGGLVPTAAIPRTRHPLRTRYFVRMTFMRSRSVQCAHIVKPYMTACSIGLRTNGPGCAQLMPESRPGPAIRSRPIRQPAALQPMTPLHLLAAAIRACASAPGGLVPTAAILWTLRELRRLVVLEVLVDRGTGRGTRCEPAISSE